MQSVASFALINIGCLTVFTALMFRDEIQMRLIMMIGAGIFLVGFAIGDNLDYWCAGIWAALIALVNAILLHKVPSLESTSKFSQKEKILYQVFKGLKADEFRDLLKITSWNTPNTPTAHTTLTTDGDVCGSLFYVLQGKVEVSKGDKIFTLNPNTKPAYIYR
jgi:hypothetical protein